MKKQRKSKNHTKDIQLPNEKIKKLLAENFYQRSIQKINDLDVTINHLENIFADETYYLAMKIVPLLERKVLYLSYVENLRLNDICKRLKLQKKEVISLKNKGIIHFKNNLATIVKAQKMKNKGGGINENK
ncbi:hypothetical protein [Thomasclavelia cocleata]|jgi:DNA-directed RNA polymerase specialized sigma subunit|uniref:hypothetical protein n=1 Tax=Thomasclavelia cocleata TaxID=69824 RepID=UPI00272ED913|nr:hypothetical protein [Thomasclavelia cocleata]